MVYEWPLAPYLGRLFVMFLLIFFISIVRFPTQLHVDLNLFCSFLPEQILQFGRHILAVIVTHESLDERDKG
jgi:hypothetical protein